MRLRTATALAGIWLAGSGMALGQTVDRGTEVTVNPLAGGGSGILLYPGDQYMRVVHPALEPGETGKDLGAIQLHMPTRHSRVARKTPAASTRTASAAPPTQMAAPAAPKPAPKEPPKEAKAKPQPKIAAAAAPP